jgi:hypothetical protein
MSDFLQRLGARAVGNAAIVPRAAALFEMPSALPGDTPTAPDAMRSAPADRALPRRAPDQHVEAEAPAREAKAPRGVRASDPATGLNAQTRLPDPERDVPKPHFERRRAVDLDAESDAPRVVPLNDPTHPALPAMRVARPAAATPALVPAHKLPTPRRAAWVRPTVVAPTLTTTAGAEPVRVTIGRVEVRAVFDQAPTRTPARAAPPSPSLDEYLRKRGRS